MRKALHISPNSYEDIISAGGTRKIWEELAKIMMNIMFLRDPKI